jgi:hypothetical protein
VGGSGAACLAKFNAGGNSKSTTTSPAATRLRTSFDVHAAQPRLDDPGITTRPGSFMVLMQLEVYRSLRTLAPGADLSLRSRVPGTTTCEAMGLSADLRGGCLAERCRAPTSAPSMAWIGATRSSRGVRHAAISGSAAGGRRASGNELVMAMHEPGAGEPAYCVGGPLDLGRVRHGCSAKNAEALTPRPVASVSISSYVGLPSPAAMRLMRRADILRPSDRLLTSER